jgi:hypothetical protein
MIDRSSRRAAAVHTQMRPAPVAARGYARDPIASMLATDWRILLVIAMDYAHHGRIAAISE